jgi:diacylglycerol kinase (ATP)
LRAEDWQVDIYPTDAAQHAIALAGEAAASGAEVVFACGGDGTVNEVVNGLIDTPATLGLIRGGMGDVFAKEIGISKRPDLALHVLVDGIRRRFDTGRANGRHFLCMAGVGFDAAIVNAVPNTLKRRLGSTSYALVGVPSALRHESRPIRLTVDGAQRDASLYWLLLGNTRSYGGVLDITSDAKVDDGLLDAFFFEGAGIPWIASTAARLVTRRHENARGVSFQRIRTLEIATPGLPVQLDGEYVGETPITFEACSQTLDVLLPANKRTKLFSD